MSKAKIPVSVNGIEFDALISESRTLTSEVPEYAVEDGFSISDAIIFNPETLEMTLFVTPTPVTWYNRHGTGDARVSNICKQLEELYYTGEPVTVITSDATYKDMAITSLTLSKSTDTGYAREIPISFKQVRVTKASTTTIPSTYGKSGTTGSSSGTANTSSGSSSGSDSGKSSSSSSGNGTKSSILYSAASSIGLI